MQVLRRRSHRKRHPHAGLLAPDQACQLNLQGTLDSLERTAWNRKLIRTRPQIRIVYGMVSLRSTSSFFERGERWREKTDEDATTSQTEDFVVKYLWSAVGYCLIAIPTLGKKQDGLSIPQRTESKATYPAQRRTQGR